MTFNIEIKKRVNENILNKLICENRFYLDSYSPAMDDVFFTLDRGVGANIKDITGIIIRDIKKEFLV